MPVKRQHSKREVPSSLTCAAPDEANVDVLQVGRARGSHHLVGKASPLPSLLACHVPKGKAALESGTAPPVAARSTSLASGPMSARTPHAPVTSDTAAASPGRTARRIQCASLVACAHAGAGRRDTRGGGDGAGPGGPGVQALASPAQWAKGRGAGRGVLACAVGETTRNSSGPRRVTVTSASMPPRELHIWRGAEGAALMGGGLAGCSYSWPNSPSEAPP